MWGDIGTTSAHAENTGPRWGGACCRRNYLRARGEYAFSTPAVVGQSELPPCTRRIPFLSLSDHLTLGTTSAHAENTDKPPMGPQKSRNYLRARGEYYSSKPNSYFTSELPPRTRRIPTEAAADPRSLGTTSAHAENTAAAGSAAGCAGNYLRARGEYIR